ncbi:EpsG family protein [Bacillus thuringiensis]|nr:EpsG family protein [Bacillus thuringiensis]
MIIYYLVLIISVLLVKLNDYFKIIILEKKISIIYIFNALIILTLAILRSEDIGKDTPHYRIYFDRMLMGDSGDSPYEPGFYLLTKTFQLFSSDFQSFLAFCSVITLIPILYVLKKENNHYLWMTVFIFICTQYVSSFSILRGYLAVANILIAYQFINRDGKKKVYWFFLLIATLLHYSTIIYVFILWLSKKKINIRYYIFPIFIAILFSVPGIGQYMRNFIIEFMYRFRPDYSAYDMSYELDIGIVYIIIYSILAVFSLFYYKSLLKLNPKNLILINIAIIMLIFNMSMSWFPAYSRVSSSFLIFMALLVPEIIRCEKNRATRFVYKIGFCLMFIIYMYLNLPPLYSVYSFR